MIKDRNLADEVMRVDDFQVLKDLFDEDEGQEKHLETEGGFKVTDISILDDVLKRINQNLKDLKRPGGLIFVEFSRSNYEEAMKNFEVDVLGDVLIVYIYSPFELTLERNLRRFEESSGEVDDHLVPKDMMETYYKDDDYEETFLESEESLRDSTPADLVVVRNDSEGVEKLRGELMKVIEALESSE
ncbi:hypothetical protein AKJ54_00990 [candidate division MSBL1 archaeon SCGC-AAA382K21]|uniref:Thymidylate kinase-like domain-containing protein n=1 Tax=candidate division MSBL1 archaeon SCGC-AAA382K21 TaxID=1698283 RepID=A0A133VKE3_9EURY|nr:hypothetical protein AKJ54_00990 [candidate division MSBL1 archaeon SCGC-AAA382K21]